MTNIALLNVIMNLLNIFLIFNKSIIKSKSLI